MFSFNYYFKVITVLKFILNRPLMLLLFHEQLDAYCPCVWSRPSSNLGRCGGWNSQNPNHSTLLSNPNHFCLKLPANRKNNYQLTSTDSGSLPYLLDCWIWPKISMCKSIFGHYVNKKTNQFKERHHFLLIIRLQYIE